MSRLPETGPSLRRIIEQEKRRAGRAENSSAFTRSGSRVTGENEVTVDGAFIVNGPLTVTQTADITGTTHIGGATDIDGTLNVDAATTLGGNTTIGGTLGVTGVTTLGAPTTVSGTLGVTGVTTLGAATSVTGALNVSGPMAVTGTLSLPAGIIDNDALASPVVPASFYAAASNFAVPNTAWTAAVEHSLTTPAGFTQAVVIATAWARIQNTSGATASGFGTLASINGVAGPWDDAGPIPTNYFDNLEATYATLVSGLTEGQTIPISTRVFSSPALSADPDNEATINGVVLWLR